SRIFLLTPPALLSASAILMLVMAPFAWGKASFVHIPAWMPTGAGLAFGIAGLAIGGRTLLNVTQRTRREYSAFGFHLIVGTGLMLLATVLELGLASRIANSSTYSSFVDSSGRVQVTSAAFAVYTVAGIFMLTALTGMFAWIYAQAITDAHLSKAA